MGKSNLFTLFITVIAVVIVAEVLVNDYGTLDEVGANLLSSEESSDESVENPDNEETGGSAHDWNMTFDELAGEEGDNEDSSDISEESNEDEKSDLDEAAFDVDNADAVEAEISFGLIGLSGFQNVTLQRIPFNGILFERVDLRDFQSVDVVQQNLLQNNAEKIALFYEFHAGTELLANEIYLYIKDKAAKGLNVGINVTDDYGNGSFYVNYADVPDRAFLVVNIRESVYALTYEKGLHSMIESLLGYLNT